MDKTPLTAFENPPKWAKSAIWYQIFVERFYNGNTNNNPTLETMQWSLEDAYPDDWAITPWIHDWYQQEDWAKSTGLDFYRTAQMRRYGGDLEGVIQKLDYLEDLGINAIYFNPINDAPSLHKYDARSYHHVDITFGGNKENNLKALETENPADPSTWVWTEADKLFLDIIADCHQRGIKVVLDFSWNHTGRAFWAFQDIMKNKEQSPFKDWYEIKSFDGNDGGTGLSYDGWFGIKSLPELRKIRETEKIEGQPYEGNMPDAVKQHIFEVSRRWMDPNGDGDPSDGIDGMRLDVAEHVPLGFWRDFRQHIRSINPDFYLVGENWWSKWPDELMDPQPWVQGDIFDAVMHYHWYKPARGLFNRGDDSLSVEDFFEEINRLNNKYRPQTKKALMNLMSSHDSPRFWTSIANPGKYKFRCKPTENPEYNTGKPSEDQIAEGKALLLHQFTMEGAPHIFNGDEMGMWGADDPDNRKPLWWKEFDFEKETPSSYSTISYHDQPMFNAELFQYYKELIQLRKSAEALSLGDFVPINDFANRGILAYQRVYNDETIHVYINTTASQQSLAITTERILYNLKTQVQSNEIIIDGFGGLVFVKK